MSRNHMNSLQTIEKSLEDLATGFKHHFPKGDEFVLNGVTYTPLHMAKTLEELVTPYKDARVAHVVLTDKTRVRDDGHPAVSALVKAAKKFLVARFGETSSELLKFGIEPKKAPVQLTAEQKAEKAAKARATRAKNGNGSKKKGRSAGPAAGPSAS